MNETLRRSGRMEYVALGLFVAFMVLAVTLVYWALVRGPSLAQRADNPRVVEAELRIRRGRLLDANGVVLAETIGPVDDPNRVYPIPSIGPAVGYYSFRHGTAGIEEGYDQVLRGEDGDPWGAFWRRSLHRSQSGQDVRLTLNADWQRNAEALFGEHSGAALALTVPDGAVKLMVSHPTYDPNRLGEHFDELVSDEQSPLLNRVTQGQYQPGLAIQPFILAAGLERGVVSLDDSLTAIDERVAVRDQIRECHTNPPQDPTWATVLAHACPAPMLDLADDFGADGLTGVFEDFGFFSPPAFPLVTATAALEPVVDVREAILGQESLTVTPLQLARAWVALGSGGALPTPYLVTEVQNSAGVWQPVEPTEPETQSVSVSTADALLGSLATDDGNIAEHTTVALAGPEAATNAWYLGFTPARTPRYAVVLVIEGTTDTADAQDIGRALLNMMQATE
ncbi:MAG: penicillin-binding transpeptidase domain-containing protein [Chloroflexota bacterium]